MIVHFTYQERGHWLDDAISLRASYMTTGSLVFDCFLCFLQNISKQTLLAGGGGGGGGYKCWNTYILGKKALLGHGSTRGISSNTVCRALNLFNLLYLINWKHFSWKKLIFEEVALILMNFGLKCPPEIKNFHFLGATSSKINFFQEKCLQFTSYNNLKRFRALQTVFEDMTLVLPCPNKAFLPNI